MKNELKISILSNDAQYVRELHTKLSKENKSCFQLFKSASEFLYELPNRPDIVFVDASLTDMSAPQLVKAIKDFHYNINIVLLIDEISENSTLKKIDHLTFSTIIKGNLELDTFNLITDEIVTNRIEFKLKMEKALKKRSEILNNLRSSLDHKVKDKKASNLLAKLWESR